MDPRATGSDEIGGIVYQIVKIAYGARGEIIDASIALPFPVRLGAGANLIGIPYDFLIEVAKGNVSGHSAMNKFGANPDIDAASGFEDLWDGGGIWVPPTTARLHDLASTSVNDTDGGSGAERVLVEGLDGSLAFQSETRTLNGQEAVATANAYAMIHRMIVTQSNNGANDAMNAGVITATAQTDATVTAQINAGNNQTLMAIYQIPAATTGYLLDFYATEAVNIKESLCTIKLFAKPEGQPFQIKEVRSITATGDSAFQNSHRLPPRYAAKTILKMQADASKNDTGVAGGFCLLLVDD